jgi:putative oxidoreductase
MKKYFAARKDTVPTDVAILVVRVITGYAFILHGWDKILNPFGWMPGSNIPGIFQGLAAFAEFGGGIALILGLFSRLSAFGLVITMIVAAYVHAISFGHPFVAKGGPSFEPATTYFMISLLLLILGAGRYSLDAKIFGIKEN